MTELAILSMDGYSDHGVIAFGSSSASFRVTRVTDTISGTSFTPAYPVAISFFLTVED